MPPNKDNNATTESLIENLSPGSNKKQRTTVHAGDIKNTTSSEQPPHKQPQEHK